MNLKKLTKKGLIDYLKSVEDKVKDDTVLTDRIVYTLSKAGKDGKNALKADLFDLADEIQTTLAAKSFVTGFENSAKEEDEVDIKKPTKAKSKAKVKAKAKAKKSSKPKKKEAKVEPVKSNEGKVRELAEIP